MENNLRMAIEKLEFVLLLKKVSLIWRDLYLGAYALVIGA